MDVQVPDILGANSSSNVLEARAQDGAIFSPSSPTALFARQHASASSSDDNYNGLHTNPNLQDDNASSASSQGVVPRRRSTNRALNNMLEAFEGGMNNHGPNHGGGSLFGGSQSSNVSVDGDQPPQHNEEDDQYDEYGAPRDPPYPEFNAGLLRIQGQTNPTMIASQDPWVKMSHNMVEFMKPCRAYRILIPASLFARDATVMNQLVMPVNEGKSRAIATASLLGMMFAGTAMGLPSGDLAARKRAEQKSNNGSSDSGNKGRKEKSPDIQHVDRYVYIPPCDQEDEWPMWRMGYEEILNQDLTEVTFVGVWIWVFDPTFSTSDLMVRVMQNNAMQLATQTAVSQAPENRSKAHATEAERRKKAGLGIFDLNNNFDGTVGMQFGRITDMCEYQTMLKQHGGQSYVDQTDAMFVEDFEKHINNAAGRKKLSGDTERGFGSLHPLGIEFVCNAKRERGLRYGAVNLDGSKADIHEKYLNVDSYWEEDYFRLPEEADVWICPLVDKRTIFEMPLPRKLQNQVTPGDALMRLFLDEAKRKATPTQPTQPAAAADKGSSSTDPMEVDPDGHGDEEDEEEDEEGEEEDEEEAQQSMEEEEEEEDDSTLTKITRHDYTRFRSFVMDQDELQKRADENIRSKLNKYDIMSETRDVMNNNSLSNGEIQVTVGEKEGNYQIRVDKITDRIAEQSTRIWSKLVLPWITRETRDLKNREQELSNKTNIRASDVRWKLLERDERRIRKRFVQVKKELTVYHLRSLHACFHSAKDRNTIPAGYKAMVEELEKHVEMNGGSASMAFPPNRKGKQIMSTDRQVWHELQEWLGVIFTKDALIEGRDRFILDEMYLQTFEVYAQQRFVLIVCSERGKGKSVRATRLGKLLPRGFVATQAASSARAGMNGNMSYSNGRTIVYDEMTSDLTPPEVTERIEMWKQKLTNGEYTIERTVSASKADGSSSYVTCEIVTDHSVSYVICTNMGPCFTLGDRKPSAGKFAMINRTISLFARTETNKASQDDAFERNIQTPQVAERIQDFRLFTCLVSFCKLAMRKCPWLQPDMSYANLVWKQGDTMLQDEYGMPAPEPRRMGRRTENCSTQSIMEAVARVFLYKQTAINYEAGKPLPGTCIGKQFDIGDLYDVLRLASVPSRAVIRDAWVKSLTYSISTSPNGVNVMTSVCHLANMGVTNFFRKISSAAIKDLFKDNDSTSNPIQVLTPVLGSKGTKQEELKKLGRQLSNDRRLRNFWRKKAIRRNVSEKSAVDAIKEVIDYEDASTIKSYTNALMPTMRTVGMHYNPNHVLKWAFGQSVDMSENSPMFGMLQYRPIPGKSGGAQLYDHAWLLVRKNESADLQSFDHLAMDMMNAVNGTTPAALFEYHLAGIVDTLLLMETSEAKRLCPEMPRNKMSEDARWAFADEKNNQPNKESKAITLRKYKDVSGRELEAYEGDLVDCRVEDGEYHHSRIPIHQRLDIITNRGRLPALQPHASARLTECTPLRRARESGIELNAVVAYEHMAMLVEASIRCSEVDGLRGHQENFRNGDSASIDGFIARSNGGIGRATNQDSAGELTKLLPFSNDVMQIGWTIDLAERQYCDTMKEELKKFNEYVRENDLPGGTIKIENMPEQPLPFMGYPIARRKRSEESDQGSSSSKQSQHHVLQLLSLKPKLRPSSDHPKLEISTASKNSNLTEEEIYNECAVSLGRAPTPGDLDDHRRYLIGDENTHGVTGDVNAMSTWSDHMYASMASKGNIEPFVAGTTPDPGISSYMDAELMLLCRLVERQAQVKDSPEHVYDIQMPWAQNYSAIVKNEKAPLLQAMSSSARQASKRPVGMTGYHAMRSTNAYSAKKPRGASDKSRAGSSKDPVPSGAMIDTRREED